jgi:vacuolar-type H+-ATPase subunit D/Vma8
MTEVNRIFGVLKRNLVSPPSQRFGMQQTPSQVDPKREEVRKLLQKHLQLKERELHQSCDTLNLANDTIIIRQNENVDN